MPKKTDPNEEKLAMTSFRIPAEFMERADRIGNLLPAYGCPYQSRSSVFRLALEYGLAKLEEEMRNSQPVVPVIP